MDTTESTASTLLRFARSLAAATWGGALLGLLVGGVGGRVAMRVLFLTSPDSVRGMESDDGFTIGRFGLSDTLGLLALTAMIGVIAGLLYLWTRRWLPGSMAARSAILAVFGGVVVGGILVHTDGVDFTVLRPRWLAILLFIAIPGAFGALIAPVVERLDRPDSWFHTQRPYLALPPLAILLLPPVLLLLVGPIAAVAIARLVAPRNPEMARLWNGPAIDWAGRAVVAAIFAAGVVGLWRDVTTLL